MGGWACASCGSENPEGTAFCGRCGARTPPAADIAGAIRTFVAGTIAKRIAESQTRIPEERRLVTAMFADISGFTRLADRLDPEELLDVIDPLVSALSSIVARYDGYVEKFAGDALLALFGAPTSHDDDAARALRVALEMHAEIERMKARLPSHASELTLHIGVNSGHGIARMVGSEARMDYAVLGDAVILAQRLESEAPPRQTYVSESTVRLAEHRFEFEPVGELVLKGKTQPVSAWRLLGEKTAPMRPSRSPLVGRASELALLTRSIATGGVVTVAGEPGIGKSRLVEEAHALTPKAGLRWLAARSVSYGASLAFWPFLDLLRREGGGRGPFIAQLLGQDHAETAPVEPEAYRRGLHDAIVSWLTEIPSVLVVEDAHWLDASSRSLIAELARRSIPHALVLTARPEAEPLLTEMLGDRVRLVLAPLDEAQVEELLRTHLGARPPHRLAEFITRRTAGNPFFVQELVRALEDSHAFVREGETVLMRSGWDARELPPTVEEVLSARMEALSKPAAAALQTAAVIGRRVPERLLAAVSGDTPALDELVAAGFLFERELEGSRVFVFQHALVQDVAYERLLRKERRRLHGLVADQAELLYGSGDDVVDLLARHMYLSGHPKAIPYLRRAAQRASRLYANEEAILHLTRCAELVPDDMGLRVELAELHELVGNYSDAERLYVEVRNATQDLRAWRGLAATHRKRGEYSSALEIVEEALASQVLSGADLTSILLERGWTLSVAGRFKEAIAALTSGLKLASDRTDSVIGQLLFQLSRAETASGLLDDAIEHARSARTIADAKNDPRLLASTSRVLGDAYRLRGDLDAAAAILAEGLSYAERTGSIEEIGGCLINLGLVELERRHIDVAIAHNRRAIEEFERVGHGSGRAWGYSNLAWALANAGQYAEAEQVAARSLEFSRAIAHLITAAETLDTRAFIALQNRDNLRAEREAVEAAELFVQLGADPKAAEAYLRAATAAELTGNVAAGRAYRAQALAHHAPHSEGGLVGEDPRIRASEPTDATRGPAHA